MHQFTLSSCENSLRKALQSTCNKTADLPEQWHVEAGPWHKFDQRACREVIADQAGRVQPPAKPGTAGIHEALS